MVGKICLMKNHVGGANTANVSDLYGNTKLLDEIIRIFS